MKSQLTIGVAALGFFRSCCLICVPGVCSREKAFVFVCGARAVTKQKSSICNCAEQRPQCLASMGLQDFLLCFKMTWGISSERQRLQNEEGSLAAVRDPGQPLLQKPVRSPPTAGAALARRTPLPAASWASSHPGSMCGCWLRSTPGALEPPSFLLGWANAEHSWVGEGGGLPRPLPPVGSGGWLHRGSAPAPAAS